MIANKQDKSFEVVSPFQDDPFVGHLSTPITTSSLTKTYLSLLPAIYKRSYLHYYVVLILALFMGTYY